MPNFETSAQARAWLAVLDAVPDAFLIVGAGGRIVLANRPMHMLFGYDAETLVGRNVDELLPEQLRSAHAAFRQSFAAAPARREMGRGRHLVGLRRDGIEIPVEVGLSSIVISGEQLVVAVVRDVSFRRAAEMQMHELNALLERRVVERTAELQTANRDLRALSHSMAHDLRAPLRALNGFTALLSERLAAVLDADSARLMRNVGRSALELDAMLSDYLRIIEVFQHEVVREDIDLNVIIERAWASIYGRYSHDPELATTQLPVINADRTLLTLLIEELLDNAAKFTARTAAPKVTVSAAESEFGLSLVIVDNGTGFDATYADKLFGIFERLHSREFPGNGAGLALVKRAMDRHGGTIRLESSQAGTRAIATFPRTGSKAWRNDGIN